MKSKNLLLVSCKADFLENSHLYPPLGLLYLKSYVNKHLPNVNVDVVDDYSLLSASQFEPYDVVGLSVMTPQRSEARQLATNIKIHYPLKTVVVGGPHITHYLDEVLGECYDYFVVGDGEKSLVHLLSTDVKLKSVLRHPLSVRDIADIPRADRTSEQSRRLLANYSYTLNGRNATTLMTSRGCSERCGFCEAATEPIRFHKPELVARELDDIKELGYKAGYIFDDLFAMNEQRVRIIGEELRQRDLIYRCNIQARRFTKDGDSMARLLADTGCVEVAIGVESGSQELLNNVSKGTTVEQNLRAIKFAKQTGMKVKAYLMLGLPGETYQTMRQTEEVIRSSGIDDFQLSVFFPYKGTPIRSSLERDEGMYDIEIEREGTGAYGQKGGNSEAVVRTSNLTSNEILAFRDELVRKYKPKSHKEKWRGEK